MDIMYLSMSMRKVDVCAAMLSRLALDCHAERLLHPN